MTPNKENLKFNHYLSAVMWERADEIMDDTDDESRLEEICQGMDEFKEYKDEADLTYCELSELIVREFEETTDDLENYLLRCGFKFTETGGGCTAYEKVNADGTEQLITNEFGMAPKSLGDVGVLSHYSSNGDHESEQKAPTLAVLIGRHLL